MKVYNTDHLVQIDFESTTLSGDDIVTEMRTRIDKVLEKLPQANIVFNFAEVEHISSAVLGELVLSQMKITTNGGQMRLAALNKNVQASLSISGLQRNFQICETVRDAAASFN